MLKCEWYTAKEKRSKRLLIALHGLGDSAAGYRWLPEVLDLPWLSYLLVNAPDPYYEGFSWYDFAGNAAPGIQRSRALLFQLLDELREKGDPSEQMVVLGFSQGCLMTWEVGLKYPHKLAGLVGISGYAHEPETATREFSAVAKEQKFLITHGTMDPLIPFDQVKRQVMTLKAAGLQIEWHEFEKAHTIAGEEEVNVVRKFICERFQG
jgi:phospholipase/carboxylesterase